MDGIVSARIGRPPELLPSDPYRPERYKRHIPVVHDSIDQTTSSETLHPVFLSGLLFTIGNRACRITQLCHWE